MIHYRLSWGNANEHLFDIEISFTARENDPRLSLPAWRPGRYLIQNYAANVRQWSANLRKTGKSEWQVRARAGEDAVVRYRFYAGVLDAGSSFLDLEEGYVNGSNLFMMVNGRRDERCRLSVATEWTVETQLPRAVGTPGQQFDARDYDHLIDSPVIASDALHIDTFDESGAEIRLVWRGAEGIDTSLFVEPLRGIAQTHAALFSGLPLTEYRFLFHVTDRWHGVEHESSCSITCDRRMMLGARAGDEGFDHFLSICSHEFFHLWNVKRILPARFQPYDYSAETPTRLLWVMEGVTAYYGELTLVRSGSWSEERYLAHLAREIELLESSPARRTLSLAQASFDAWLQDASHDRANASISFYNKGEIVAALLDLHLRSSGSSLDEVMRALWRDYGRTGRGLEEDVLEQLTEERAGEFFERYVHGVDALPYASLLNAAGIVFDSTPKPSIFSAKLRVTDGTLMVSSVMAGSVAEESGIMAGDELLAVAGQRVRNEIELSRLMKAFQDTQVEMLTARAGRVRAVAITPRIEDGVSIALRIYESANERQTNLRERWLGRMG